jgi:hypothetical protein
MTVSREDRFVDTTFELLDDIHVENLRQLEKWGVQDHSLDYWVGILGEEFGESAKACIERDIEGLKKELIQVAAVCTAFIEAIHRYEDNNESLCG